MYLPKLLPLVVCAAVACTPAMYGANQKSAKVRKIGTTTLSEAAARAQAPSFAGQTEGRPKSMLKQMPKPGHPSFSGGRDNQGGNLMFAGYPVVGPTPSFSGFDALDSTDSGDAVGFVDEPPDQGMSTNGNQVAEAVNLAFQVFSTAGKPLTAPIGLYAFYNVSEAQNADGSFTELSDPRVFFDWESGRWFVTILEYYANANGLTGGSNVLIAVSDSSDATGSYTINSVDVSDAGYGGCPCLGDQPLLGVNQDGVYLNDNEYATSTLNFETTLITAINKQDLINGTTTPIAVAFDGLNLPGGQAFSIEPAFPSPGTATDANMGTEFFTSSLDFNGTGDNRIAVWSLTNTESLKDNVPNLKLQQTIVQTEEYQTPQVGAVQKVGPFPLGQALHDPEETLNPNDDRMLQLYYSKGELYSGLNTTLLEPGNASAMRNGAAWFAVQPYASSTTLSARVTSQGYIGIANGSVLYPAFAVDSTGQGAIAFTITGQNYFPSTGYVKFQGNSIQPQVHLAGIGQAPEDGFSGYAQFGGAGYARWGDYGAAMVAPDGSIWLASEYIPNPATRPRTSYTDWGTFISRIQ